MPALKYPRRLVFDSLLDELRVNGGLIPELADAWDYLGPTHPVTHELIEWQLNRMRRAKIVLIPGEVVDTHVSREVTRVIAAGEKSGRMLDPVLDPMPALPLWIEFPGAQLGDGAMWVRGVWLDLIPEHLRARVVRAAEHRYDVSLPKLARPGTVHYAPPGTMRAMIVGQNGTRDTKTLLHYPVGIPPIPLDDQSEPPLSRAPAHLPDGTPDGTPVLPMSGCWSFHQLGPCDAVEHCCLARHAGRQRPCANYAMHSEGHRDNFLHELGHGHQCNCYYGGYTWHLILWVICNFLRADGLPPLVVEDYHVQPPEHLKRSVRERVESEVAQHNQYRPPRFFELSLTQPRVRQTRFVRQPALPAGADGDGPRLYDPDDGWDEEVKHIAVHPRWLLPIPGSRWEHLREPKLIWVGAKKGGFARRYHVKRFDPARLPPSASENRRERTLIVP